ncbi:MAG: ATP-binding protein [Candidatus Thiodiazotropha sp. (ex Ctena orbiculata)]|nr:ATP-binding protein [Candidatus Thiodiazotropha taylori]
MNDDIVGHVVGVHGFKVRVELASEIKSPVRAYSSGSNVAIAINSYLAFDIGAGQHAVGIVTDLDTRENYEPDDEELTLELTKPRRIAVVQLLGTVEQNRTTKLYQFNPGISILPTLDTPAAIAKVQILNALFVDAPKRNRPEGHGGDDYDVAIRLGNAVAVSGQEVKESFNDLMSRPLAIVGNTGSGKSYTVSRLVQQATKERSTTRARIFILDINGEYTNAFKKNEPEGGRKPNHIYVNGKEFGVPVWMMNTREVCDWLSAGEQAQQPALVNLWSVAKGEEERSIEDSARLAAESIARIDQLIMLIKGQGPYKGHNARQVWSAYSGFANDLELNDEADELVKAVDEILQANRTQHQSFGEQEREIQDSLSQLRTILADFLTQERDFTQQSADKPIYFPLKFLSDPSELLEAARLEEGDNSFRQFLRGLQLRIGNRLQDQRWSSFFNYDNLGLSNFKTWLNTLGIGQDLENGSEVCVIDCSMIGHEVLPYICGIIGRLLLEVREHVDAEERFHEPWVVVLEEAHNYIRPRRQDEPRGIAISRETFERIAKEGRKFGISLFVASQRPSDISPTVLSQCANFVMHRLQNPDDIEHFRRIVPSQSRRLLDQITILSAGEAIVLGSAFHIPSRVHIDKPEHVPSSQSSAPHVGWHPDTKESFDLDSALKNWGIEEDVPAPVKKKSAKKNVVKKKK